jgi:hypothetical protein
MSLGPFTVDRHGLLQPASPERFPSFSVRWRNRLVKARLVDRQEGGESGRLEFSSHLGRIPSTAAAPERAGQRDGALSLLRALPSMLPQGWAMHLSPDHSVVFATTSAVQFPISAVSLVSLVTDQLLALTPYLEALDEVGIDGPVLGMVNT